jgi:hypothetical protein
MKFHNARRLASTCLFVMLLCCGQIYGTPCTNLSVSPPGPFNVGSGNSSIQVDVSAGLQPNGLGIPPDICSWLASAPNFIQVTPSSEPFFFHDSGHSTVTTVTIQVGQNPDLAPRNASVVFTGQDNSQNPQIVSINQDAASGNFGISANPTDPNVLPGASTSVGVSISRSGGFAGSVSLSASGQPSGVNVTFNPGSTTGVSSTATITTATNVAVGNYQIFITGRNGNVSSTTSVTLHVVDFSLSSCASALVAQPGGSASCVLSVNPINGFSGAVTLSASGQPNGANITFNPNPATGSSTMAASLSGSVAAGIYPITITGVSGNTFRTTSVNLNVTDFAVSARPANASVLPGGTTSYQVSITALNGFSGGVSLSATGQPNGANVTFSPNPATSSSTMMVTTSGSTTLGGYPLTITGQNGPTSHTTSVTLNVNGPPVAMSFVPVTPCRIADTRNPSGPFGGPFLSGGTFREFDIPNSACSIPATATAYSLNITAIPKAGLGFLAAVPCGQQQPLTSNLNSDGRVKAVAAIVPAGTNGGVCLFPTQDTDVILDINGYFVPPTASPNGLAFYPITPCRIVDTRNPAGPLGGPALVGQATRTFPLLSSTCNVPSSAQAYSLNFTALPSNGLGFLTAWAAGQPQPAPSILNAPFGATAANAAIVTAGVNGGISVFTTHDTNLIIDINGYFAPPGPGGLSLFTLTPCRILDTRIPAGSPPLNGTLIVDVTGSGCGAPASAHGYVFNATVIPPGLLGFLELWPNGAPEPGVSTLNAFDGAVTSNMAIVSTTNGSVNAFTSAPSHLVLDISGYFAP